ncbi:unnamed protein product [Camellia sinensis]
MFLCTLGGGDLADFRIGINPGPPIMSREEFETRKADLWRKRATESIAAKGCPKGVTPKYSLKPLVPSLSDIKPDIDVEKMLF